MRHSLFESGQTIVLVAAIVAAAAGILYSAAHSMAEDSRQQRDAVYVSLLAQPQPARPAPAPSVMVAPAPSAASEDSASPCATVDGIPAACADASEMY